MPRVEPAFALYLRLMLALGMTFQMPTLVLFLARMGLVTPRFLIKNFKYAVLIIVIAAAVLSPDGGGVGMVVMGGPVVVLYIFSIGLAWLFGKKKKRPEDRGRRRGRRRRRDGFDPDARQPRRAPVRPDVGDAARRVASQHACRDAPRRRMCSASADSAQWPDTDASSAAASVASTVRSARGRRRNTGAARENSLRSAAWRRPRGPRRSTSTLLTTR